MSETGLTQAVAKMRARGLDELSIRVFEHYYALVEQGATGTIPEDLLEPLGEVMRYEEIDCTPEQAREAMSQVAVVKLNGGLGTGMGMAGPKSALVVKDGLTFLDIIARQVLALREQYGVDLPLILMNSFRTREESLAILSAYPTLAVGGVPLDFVQGAEPKLRADDLTPVEWAADPELEWCPPGHGDLFVALVTSGILKTLRDKGFRYVFVSNSDNLGATCDPRIAAWMAAGQVPFVAEVCERTRSDRKGGHLARRRSDGRVVLRDSAQVSLGEEDHFQDTGRHATFNSNNLWFDLEDLAAHLDSRDGMLGLPVIVNRKTVDPSDASSPEVVQIETAMGTAIETFDGAQPVLVPRARFRPVKTTNDLLVLRSDVFGLDEQCQVVARREGAEPVVTLDGAHYKLVPQFEEHFPCGAPSLIDCLSLTVRGDVTFGEDVVCVGSVEIEALEPMTVEHTTVGQV